MIMVIDAPRWAELPDVVRASGIAKRILGSPRDRVTPISATFPPVVQNAQ